MSVSLFPMVILTMTIERLSIIWEERGGGNAFKVAARNPDCRHLAYLLMSIPELAYFIFTFPAVLMILVGFHAGNGPLPRLPADRTLPLQSLPEGLRS